MLPSAAVQIDRRAALFFGGIFFLPAAFLQVARHRRFTAACYKLHAVRVIAVGPGLYVDAWIAPLAVGARARQQVPTWMTTP